MTDLQQPLVPTGSRPLLFRDQLRADRRSGVLSDHRKARSGSRRARHDPEHEPEHRGRLRFWSARLRRRQNLVLAAAVGVIVGWITGVGSATGPIRFDDEGTYVSQAISVLHGHLAPYTYWYDHPPLGWIILSGWLAGPGALWPGANPIATGRQLMVLVAALTAAAIVVFLRRLDVSRPAATLGGLLFGLSPVALQFHRMVLLDNLAVLFLMIAFVLAATRSRHLGATAVAGFSLSLAVMCKETLLLLVPFVIWMSWRSYRGHTRTMSATIFGLCFVLPASFYPLLALFKGELVPGPGHVSLWGGVAFQLFTRKASGGVFDPTSNAHAVVSGWFASDWYLLAAGALCWPLLLLRRRRWPFAAAVLLSGLILLRPGYLPVPYVVVLVPLAAVCVGLGLDQLVAILSRPFRRRADRRAVVGLRIVSVLVALSAVVGLASVVPAGLRVWQIRDAVYQQHDFDAPYRLSSSWLLSHTRPDQVLVADNVTWTDLVDGGHRPQVNTIWFTKLGTDQQVDSRISSWQQIDYVVETDIMTNGDKPPILADALEHSTVVQRWGNGSQSVIVHRVEP